QLAAMAVRAFLRGLILTQKHADVLLVLLLLEIDEEGEDALESTRLSVKKLLSRRRRQLLPRNVHRDAFLLRELGEGATLVLVTRHRPRGDRAFTQSARGVGDDQRLVVLERCAKA